ncbi:HAD family hydrolase [Nocardia halotolerans]|uniref:HAD family hydrolase n=1 Tax=Nocardia halotolerans TaxID=1755878 RepID=A0ABV8VKV6_9NOCA
MVHREVEQWRVHQAATLSYSLHVRVRIDAAAGADQQCGERVTAARHPSQRYPRGTVQNQPAEPNSSSHHDVREVHHLPFPVTADRWETAPRSCVCRRRKIDRQVSVRATENLDRTHETVCAAVNYRLPWLSCGLVRCEDALVTIEPTHPFHPHHPVTATVATPTVPVAFVDVDETLVRDISFLSLFRFDAQRRGDDPEPLLEEFWALRAAGVGRAESHRFFYRLWRGRRVEQVRAIGRDWFAERARSTDFINSAVADRLRELAARGTRIVLVSGSFDAALLPIARYVAADATLCTELVVAAGHYTGETRATMVGMDKAAALRGYAERTEVDLGTCAAFGDHRSDVAMFDLVGHPVVVGDADHHLRNYPAERLPG